MDRQDLTTKTDTETVFTELSSSLIMRKSKMNIFNTFYNKISDRITTYDNKKLQEEKAKKADELVDYNEWKKSDNYLRLVKDVKQAVDQNKNIMSHFIYDHHYDIDGTFEKKHIYGHMLDLFVKELGLHSWGFKHSHHSIEFKLKEINFEKVKDKFITECEKIGNKMGDIDTLRESLKTKNDADNEKRYNEWKDESVIYLELMLVIKDAIMQHEKSAVIPFTIQYFKPKLSEQSYQLIHMVLESFIKEMGFLSYGINSEESNITIYFT